MKRGRWKGGLELFGERREGGSIKGQFKLRGADRLRRTEYSDTGYLLLYR